MVVKSNQECVIFNNFRKILGEAGTSPTPAPRSLVWGGQPPPPLGPQFPSARHKVGTLTQGLFLCLLPGRKVTLLALRCPLSPPWGCCVSETCISGEARAESGTRDAGPLDRGGGPPPRHCLLGGDPTGGFGARLAASWVCAARPGLALLMCAVGQQQVLAGSAEVVGTG